MATKKVQVSTKRTVQPARKSAQRHVARKAAGAKPAIKDPVGRYMHDHWGALGKDYKPEY